MCKGKRKAVSKMTAVLLTLMMAVTFIPTHAFASQTQAQAGTADDPILINSAEEFAAMEADKCYKLNADITVTKPYENTFNSIFDGNGHTVTLDINESTANIGLFKSLSGAAVTSVYTKGSVTGTANYVGGLAGEATGNTTIEDCHNEAEVSGAKGNAAGLIGRAYNGVEIINCSNTGTVEGSGNRVGGIVGYSSAGEVSIEQCANAGTVTGTNNQIGGIVGNVSGGTVTIENTYNTGAITGTGQYSNMLGGIIGQTTKSGPTDVLINCYNVGTCSFSQSTNNSIGAMVGNKSNNGSTANCYFLESSAAVAVGGVTAEGVTSKTEEEMKAAGFVSALNGSGDAFVADSANINNGYPILSWQAPQEQEDTEANLAAVTAAKTAFDNELGALKPSFKTDSNIVSLVQAKVNGYEGCEGVTVSLKSSDEPDWIAADGTITYNAGSLNAYGMNSKNVYCVFTFTKGTQTVDSAQRTAVVGWNQTYYAGKMAEEAQGLTANTIKGENASLDEVTENLTLPQIMTTSSRTAWSQIVWTSSNEDVIKIDPTGYDTVTDPKQGTVTRPNEDTVVTLTATFTANEGNLNTNVEKVSDFETTVKTFEVTVKKTEVVGPTEEELQALLDTYYTADLFEKFEDKTPLDFNNVTGDIQLPLYTKIKDQDNNLVFNNKEITVTSSDENVVRINAYRAFVDVFQDEDKTVTLTASFTRGGITVTKTFTVTVIAVTDAQLDAEYAALMAVKDKYFDGINDGRYADKDSVNGNLHAFQEANVDADGNVSWVYNVNDMTNVGIVPDGYFEDSVEMEQAGYNKFKSSAPSVIAHENLVLTMPEKETQVTITSWLSSEKYRYLAPLHPDNEKLQKLYKQEVSVTVTVKVPHVHKLVHYEAKAATDTADGNIEYWFCAGCGKYFADENGEKELTKDKVIIPKKGAGNGSGTTPAKTGTVLSSGSSSFAVTSADSKNPTVSFKGTKAGGTVKIPATVTVNGVKYKVTAIAPKAFFKNKKVKKVIVGSNIITIGSKAFSKCKKLKTLTIGPKVAKIGAKCFDGSKKLKTLTVKSTKLTKKGVKNSLKGSKIKTVKVKVGSKKVNKKYVKKYKKIFTKKNCEKKVKVK